MPPTVSVIIVSYNTREMTLDCLRTLYQHRCAVPFDVWVVDNASTDDSVSAIRAAFPSVNVIANTDNRGFGQANNQAMERASGKYFLLLNSDAFITAGALDSLIAHLNAHPDTAAVGPRLLNRDGSLQTSCYRFPSPVQAWAENLWLPSLVSTHHSLGDYRRWPHDVEREVDWVIGACLLVRRVVYEQIGGFDPRFFMYAEETDWQRRMRQAGWRIQFTPAARVTHLGGASGAREKARINQNFFDSLDRYERKHHGLLGLVSLRIAMILGGALRLPLWAAVAAARPTRRSIACSKVLLYWWLIRRQATHWRPTLEERS